MATPNTDPYAGVINWLSTPYYSPSEQSWRFPGFASWWNADPAPVRSMPEARVPLPPPPPPPVQDAVGALRAVVPLRDTGGGEPGGVPGTNMGVGTAQGLAYPGGYTPSEWTQVKDLWNNVGPLNPSVPGTVATLAGLPLSVPGAGLPLQGVAQGALPPDQRALPSLAQIGRIAQDEATNNQPHSNMFSEFDPVTHGLSVTDTQAAKDIAGQVAARAYSQPAVTAPVRDLLDSVYGQPVAPNSQPPTPAPTQQAVPASTPVAPTPVQVATVDDQVGLTGPAGKPGNDAWSGLDGQDKSNPAPDNPNGTSVQGDVSKSDMGAPADPGVAGKGEANQSTPGNEAAPGPGDSQNGGPGSGGPGAGAGGLGGQSTDGPPANDPGAAPSGSADNSGAGANDAQSGGGPAGGVGSSPLVHGGPIGWRNRVPGTGNPHNGGDNEVITAKRGEFILPVPIVRGIRDGEPGSASAALRAVRAGVSPLAVQPGQPRAMGGSITAANRVPSLTPRTVPGLMPGRAGGHVPLTFGGPVGPANRFPLNPQRGGPQPPRGIPDGGMSNPEVPPPPFRGPPQNAPMDPFGMTFGQDHLPGGAPAPSGLPPISPGPAAPPPMPAPPHVRPGPLARRIGPALQRAPMAPRSPLPLRGPSAPLPPASALTALRKVRPAGRAPFAGPQW